MISLFCGAGRCSHLAQPKDPLCEHHAAMAALRTRASTGTPTGRAEYFRALSRRQEAGVWIPADLPWDLPTPGAKEHGPGSRDGATYTDAKKIRQRRIRKAKALPEVLADLA